MKHILFVGLLFCWVNLSEAQQVTFSKVFSNFPLNPENGWVLREFNGSYMLLSAVGCLDNQNYTCCMISKVSDTGNIIWSHIYPFRPTVSNMVVYNNKVFASGHTNGANSQFVLYCIDSLGSVLWNKEYGNPLVEDEFPHLTLWENNLVLCGAQDRNINNRPAPIMYLVVTDTEGNKLKEFYYGENNESTLPQKIGTDIYGNCIISFKYCPNTCFLDLKAGLASFDTSGYVNWALDLPFSYDCWSCVSGQIDSNMIALIWCVDNTDIPNHDLTPPAVFFTDTQGDILDTVVLHNQNLKEIRNMESVWENGIIACGQEYPGYLNQSSPLLAGWLFRMDGEKEIIWERSYMDTIWQGRTFGLQHVIPASDGGYLATGTITNNMTGVWESHNWLLKLDSTGCLDPGCGNINYVSDTEEAVFLNGKNIKIYPNPAKDYIQVELPADFDLRQGTYAVLASSSGGIVRREKMDGPSAQINLSGVAPGVYYVMIRRGNEIVGSKKVVVLH